MTRPGVLLLAALALTAAAAAAAAGSAAVAAPAPACPAAWKASWQKLANRIRAPVYCPSWLPDPLTGQIGGPWNNIDSVSTDRSYLVGFVWQEVSSGEIHVNLRGYPGLVRIPTCIDVETAAGKTRRTPVACFAGPRGHVRALGIDATVYAVNQDAEEGHVLYAWRHSGSLYTLSAHVAPPLSRRKVVQNLDRMLRGLVLVEPSTT